MKSKYLKVQNKLLVNLSGQLELELFLTHFYELMQKFIKVEHISFIVYSEEIKKKYRLDDNETEFHKSKLNKLKHLDHFFNSSKSSNLKCLYPPPFQGRCLTFEDPKIGIFFLIVNHKDVRALKEILKPVIAQLFKRIVSIYDYSLVNKMRQDLVDREFEIIEEKKKAEKLNLVKTEFLAKVSHEIRTPMNGISGLTHLLIEIENDPAKLLKLRLMKSSTEQLMSLIDDLLDYSKIETGKLILENVRFDIKEIFDDIVQMYTFRAIEKNINLSIDYDLADNKYVIGDFYRIQQILINLIGNSIKFTAHGFVLVKVKVNQIKDKKIELHFSVQDTGIGIGKEKLSQIFHSFTQADAAMTRKFGGTGLGLTICKELCRLMNGEIHVESELNNGSLFSVKLILTEASQTLNQIDSDKRSSVMIKENMNPLSILIVEDNDTNLFLMKSFLNAEGHTIYEARDGNEAIEKTKEVNLDIILMDIQMPNRDGYEATQEIRRQGFNIPIIALTANASEYDKELALYNGMDDFATKPVNFNRLKELLNKYHPEILKKSA